MTGILEIYVSSFWAWAGISFGVGLVLNFVFRCWDRWLISKNIANYVWPARDNMDADGDIVHQPKETSWPAH